MTQSETERRVLILGSGAREHALARALARSVSVSEVTVAPGNPGMEHPGDADLAPIRIVPVEATHGEPAVKVARSVDPHLVVVGPEAPLCAGVADELQAAGFTVFGPSAAAARLEGSKVFLKEFAVRHGIPTGWFEVVDNIDAAREVIERRGAPIVIKADGLAAGKGVTVAQTTEEALAAATEMLVDRRFGDAGAVVTIEECVIGEEISIHAISDGEHWKLLSPARDHKRIGTGDVGPNTGGMGAFAPDPRITDVILKQIDDEIVAPTINGMRAEGNPMKGSLFAGIMRTNDGGLMLLEHNVRFGDPECEVLMELIDGDVYALLKAVADGDISKADDSVQIRYDRAAVTVVLASAGYPVAPKVGDEIIGLDAAESNGAKVLHAGTTRRSDGAIVTAGGRVLAVTASHEDLIEAKRLAYEAASHISFAGMQMRTDIGSSVTNN